MSHASINIYEKSLYNTFINAKMFDLGLGSTLHSLFLSHHKLRKWANNQSILYHKSILRIVYIEDIIFCIHFLLRHHINISCRLDIAMDVNTMGALNALNFAKRCRNLQVFLHVSTGKHWTKMISFLYKFDKVNDTSNKLRVYLS